MVNLTESHYVIVAPPKGESHWILLAVSISSLPVGSHIKMDEDGVYWVLLNGNNGYHKP